MSWGRLDRESAAKVLKELWDLDQQHNGLPAVHKVPEDTSNGYVLVKEKEDTGSDHKLIEEVIIPEQKRASYNLVKSLFDNYNYYRIDEEDHTEAELKEQDTLLDFVMSTAVAEKVQQALDIPTSTMRDALVHLWFITHREYQTSGFEHVVQGEERLNRQGKLVIGGHHFWYKYYYDDGGDGGKDRIKYESAKDKDEIRKYPTMVTVHYSFHNENQEKDLGGFWVGCSIEFLMVSALLCHVGGLHETNVEIAGIVCKIIVPTDPHPGGRHLKTYYPEWFGEIPPPPSGPLFISRALVNPLGPDESESVFEMVYIGNKSAEDLPVDEYKIRDDKGKTMSLFGSVPGNDEERFAIQKQSGVVLSNQGGTLELLDKSDGVVHTVKWSKAQARRNNGTYIRF